MCPPFAKRWPEHELNISKQQNDMGSQDKSPTQDMASVVEPLRAPSRVLEINRNNRITWPSWKQRHHLNLRKEIVMNNFGRLFYVVSIFLLSGCGHLDFGPDQGLVYYDPKPYLFVTTTKDCVTTATLVSLPETKREVKLTSGYGSTDLSVNLTNGMITSIGQNTDTKIPETITSVAGLATAVGGLMKSTKAEPERQLICTPTAVLYPVENGKLNIKDPTSFPVHKEW
jgi:hypothetical protein